MFFDLRVRRDSGEFWDLSKASHRRDALRIIDEQDPEWVICGLPCTALSAINFWYNYPRLPKDIVDAKIADGLVHLKLACALYQRQIRRGIFLTRTSSIG